MRCKQIYMWHKRRPKRRHKLCCVCAGSPRTVLVASSSSGHFRLVRKNKSAWMVLGEEETEINLLVPEVLMIIALNAMKFFFVPLSLTLISSPGSGSTWSVASVWLWFSHPVCLCFLDAFSQLDFVLLMLTCSFYFRLCFENFYVNWTRTRISMRSEYFHRFIVSVLFLSGGLFTLQISAFVLLNSIRKGKTLS